MSVDRWKDPSVPLGLVRPSSGGYRSRFFFFTILWKFLKSRSGESSPMGSVGRSG